MLYCIVAAFVVAIPLFVALQWLSGALATALEPGMVRAAYGLRMLSPWPESFLTMAAIAATKAGVLTWHFGAPGAPCFRFEMERQAMEIRIPMRPHGGQE